MLSSVSETDGVTPPSPPPQPPPAPPDPAPQPQPDPFLDAVSDYGAQVAGARKALLATSLAGAVRKDPDRQAKVQALADRMGMPASAVDQFYDDVDQRARLQAIDQSGMLTNHPELARWLSDTRNASIAHDAIPHLTELSASIQRMANPDADVTGFLPAGYNFQADGTIRGPVTFGQARVFQSIDELRDDFQRRADVAGIQDLQVQEQAERLQQDFGPLANIGAGALSSLLSTVRAGKAIVGANTDTEREAIADVTGASMRLSPGFGGDLQRLFGQLVGDAPLYLLGGEIPGAVGAATNAERAAGAVLDANEAARWQRALTYAMPGQDFARANAIEKVAQAMAKVRAGAESAAPALESTYFQDLLKSSAVYAPIGARSGINTGQDYGAAYGALDALINTVGPGIFGSRVGLAGAVIPGAETAAAGSWMGAAGRLMAHVGSQGGAMAITEMANALHEYATGVNPNALDGDQLMPRLARAGAMGALMSTAFQGPHIVGDLFRRQQVASFAALDHADQKGIAVQTLKASGVLERSPDSVADLLRSMFPKLIAKTFYQKEDFEEAAKAANLTPEQLAEQMDVQKEWENAKATGKTMEVPTEKELITAAKMEDNNAIKGLLMNGRKLPNGKNATEGAQFYEEAPDQIKDALGSLAGKVKADAIAEDDPVYRDLKGQLLDAGRSEQEAEGAARLNAALFHNVAARLSTPEKPVTAQELYEPYKLRVLHESQIPKADVLDDMLNRLRNNDIPSEREVGGESLVEFIRRQGGIDPESDGGEVRDLELDAARKPGESAFLRSGGMGMDTAREAALEAGYPLRSNDIRGLLDALTEEAAGRPLFVEGGAEPTLGAIRESLLALKDELKRHNLSITQANEELKAALSGAEGPAVAKFLQPAYHGTGNIDPYERFDITRVNGAGGEGTQNEGHGIYVTGSKGAGEFYRQQNSIIARGAGRATVNGRSATDVAMELLPELPRNAVPSAAEWVRLTAFGQLRDILRDTAMHRGTIAMALATVQRMRDRAMEYESSVFRDRQVEALDEVRTALKQLGEAKFERIDPPQGRLYHVDIPDHGYLDLGKPLTQQEPEVRDKLFASGLIKRDASTGRIILPNGERIYPEQLTGDVIYDAITEGFVGDAKKTSEALYAAGIIGNRYLGDKKGEGGHGHYYNHVMFHDRDIKITRFEQEGEEGHRGSLEYNAERHFLITLTGKANRSTVIHELGHFWLEVMGDFVKREDAPAQLRQDYAKVLEFLGAKGSDLLETKHHETFARAIEQYLMEGRAPSEELKPVFHRFMLWMSRLYQQVKALVTLTPEVRRVFDRLFAADEAIRRSEESRTSDTFFKDQASSGMNDAEWSAYLKANDRMRAERDREVFNAAMDDLRRERSKLYRSARKEAMESAAMTINARPVWKAEDALVKGIDGEGKDLPQKPKLDREQLETEVGEGAIHLFPRGITGKPEDGAWSLEQAAQEFGFANKREMLDELRTLKDRSRRDEIKALAEASLRARFPDTADEDLERKAEEAVHANDAQGDILAKESAALAIKAGRRAIPQAQLAAKAEQVIRETDYLDVNPDLYLAAERKASRAATDLLLKGDHENAFFAKQQEEFAHQMVKAAQAAKKVIGKTEDIMERAATEKTRAMLGKAGGQAYNVRDANGELFEGFWDQAEAQRAADEIGGKVESAGGYQSIMDGLRQAWEDDDTRSQFTYGQVKDLYDAATETMHLARQAFTLKTEGEREALGKAIAQALDVQAKAAPERVVPFARKGISYKFWKTVREFDSLNRTFAGIAREMDGGKDGGCHWEHLVRPLNEAASAEVEMRVNLFQQVHDAFREYGKAKALTATSMEPAIGRELSLENRLAVALNMGSTKNLERLMRNFGGGVGSVTKAQLEGIVAKLDKQDWQFVRSLWGIVNSQWPAIEAKYRALHGIAPEKRDSIPVRTAFGTIDGAYWPIRYDPEAPGRAATIDLEKQQPTLWAMPRTGFAERATRSTGMPIRLDLTTLTSHLQDVSHFLTHAEAVANINKIINNAEWKQSTISRFGNETYQTLVNRVKTVAQGNREPLSSLEKGLRWLRQRSGAAVMGFNLMSGISHWFGLSQSMHEVGYGRYMAAAAKYFTNATTGETARQFIESKSTFMRTNGHAMTPEQIEALGKSALGQGTQWFRDHAYSFMHFNLSRINGITWLARYDHALEENPTDEARAIALADQAVKNTQGSGLTIDLTAAQDKNELHKLMMQYGAFFTRTYQMLRPSVVGARLSDPASIMKLGLDFASLVILPAVIRQAFLQQVKPDPSNDNSAAWWAKRLSKDSASYLLATFIGGRDLSALVDGFDYQGPAGFHTLALVSKMAKELGSDHTHAGKVGREAMLLAGSLTGLPANQLDHLIQGYLYDSEHGSANPAPLLFGPPPAHR